MYSVAIQWSGDEHDRSRNLRRAPQGRRGREDRSQGRASRPRRPGKGATRYTKDFLRSEINGLKAEIQAMINRLLLSLIGIIVGSMVAMTGIFAAIVKWL